MILTCREVKINHRLSLIENNVFTPRLLDVYVSDDDKNRNDNELNGIYMVFEFVDYNVNDIINRKAKFGED